MTEFHRQGGFDQTRVDFCFKFNSHNCISNIIVFSHNCKLTALHTHTILYKVIQLHTQTILYIIIQLHTQTTVKTDNLKNKPQHLVWVPTKYLVTLYSSWAMSWAVTNYKKCVCVCVWMEGDLYVMPCILSFFSMHDLYCHIIYLI